MPIHTYVSFQVTQIYAEWRFGLGDEDKSGPPSPKIQLVGFKRLKFGAGKVGKISFTLTTDLFKLYDPAINDLRLYTG